MNRSCILFTCVTILLSCQVESPKKDYAQVIQSSRDSVALFMQKSKVAGAAVSVSVDGKIVWSEGFGFADLEQAIHVDPAKTKFRIGSISKAMTATGLAVLYQQGKIQLDSSIYFYLPEFPKKKYRPTVRQLAGHTAGIRHYVGDEFNSSKHYATVTEGLRIFQNDTLLFRPGTKYEYSSYGFNLLGAVMEKASRKEFISFMRESVWKPLQMTNTGPDYNDTLITGRSRFYEVNKTSWINAPFVDNSYKWAGGGLLSTSEDVVKLASPYLEPGFLKRETIELFTSTQKLADGTETGYGLGWGSGTDKKGRSLFGHSGGSVGGSCNLVIYPKEKIAVAILTNISSADTYGLPRSIAELFMK